MKFNQVFSELRKSRGMTQEELAKALGVSRSTIGMYEQGKREPDFETEEKIADYFNVTLDFLRTGVVSGVPTDGQPEYYTDPETAKYAQLAHDRPDLRILMDATADLPPEQVQALIAAAEVWRKTNPDG